MADRHAAADLHGYHRLCKTALAYSRYCCTFIFGVDRTDYVAIKLTLSIFYADDCELNNLGYPLRGTSNFL